MEQIVDHSKVRFKQWVLQKPSEKEVDRGATSSGKSEQKPNNRKNKKEDCCQKQPQAGMIERRKRGNKI
jgi:hypothetical protein